MTTENGQPLSEAFGIRLQRQPSPVTCVQTCLAMALGVSVTRVINRYGDASMNQQELESALSECHIVWNRFTLGTMLFFGWYFATVPSLNRRGGLHQVLVYYNPDHGGLCVFDPAIGVQYEQNGSDLVSWSDLTPFYPGGALPEK